MRIDLHHRVIVATKPFHDAGAEVMNHDICFAEQVKYFGEVSIILQIRSEAFFVAINGVEQRAVSIKLKVRDI
jgi:hypothetical protein